MAAKVTVAAVTALAAATEREGAARVREAVAREKGGEAMAATEETPVGP